MDFILTVLSKLLEVLSLADGQVIPQGRIKYVQHLEGGIVDEILVKEGDVVESNQPIVILSSEKASSDFDDRNKNLDWENYYKSLPFNSSALALYEWSPIAEELKVLDRKIVLNSMILKWDNIQKEFKELISF